MLQKKSLFPFIGSSQLFSLGAIVILLSKDFCSKTPKIFAVGEEKEDLVLLNCQCLQSLVARLRGTGVMLQWYTKAKIHE